jgi:hypothetical protein
MDDDPLLHITPDLTLAEVVKALLRQRRAKATRFNPPETGFIHCV